MGTRATTKNNTQVKAAAHLGRLLQTNVESARDGEYLSPCFVTSLDDLKKVIKAGRDEFAPDAKSYKELIALGDRALKAMASLWNPPVAWDEIHDIAGYCDNISPFSDEFLKMDTIFLLSCLAQHVLDGGDRLVWS